MNTKTRRVLLVGFGLLIVFIGVIACTGGYYIKNADKIFTKSYTKYVAMDVAAQKANTELIIIHRAMKDVALSKDEDEAIAKRNIETALRVVQANEVLFYKQLDTIKNLDPNNTLVDEILKEYETWKPIRQNTINFTLAGEYEKAAENTKSYGAEKVKGIQQRIDALEAQTSSMANEQYEKSKADMYNSFITLIVLTIFTGFLAVLISIFVYRKLENYQNQMRLERENLKITLRSIGDGVITTDLNRNVQILNDAAEEYTGYKRAEAKGKKFSEVFDIVNEMTGEKATDPVEEVLLTNEICELENHTILTAKDGTKRHIADSAAPIKDINGITTGVVMVFRDVTEKKEVEEKLKESEEHYKMLFNSMMNGYALHKMIFDKTGHPTDYMFIDVNPAFEEMTGLFRSYCIGKTIKELMPNTEEYWIKNYAKVVKEKRPLTYENYSRELNKYFLVYAFCPIEGHFATLVQDITEKRNMEKAIFDEKERLRITFESIGDGVITTDTEKNVRMLNKVAEELTGWTSEEAFGRSFNEVFNITSELTNETAVNPVDEVLSKDKICELANHTVLTARDGTRRHIADSAAPIKDEAGNTSGVVMVFRDVTERKGYTDKIEFLSFHDGLTGIYNRAYFEQEIERIEDEKLMPVSVIMGDVNGLKLLNDVYGHKAGDELLKKIAGIMTESCGEKDIVARWGGDEFAVILPGTSNADAEKICADIKSTCESSDFQPIILSISLGVSTKENADQSLNTALKDAEDRMYTHKLVEGKSARSTIISSLQKTLFEKSCETEEHANRMLEYANAFGKYSNLSQYEMDELKLLTLLHDVGKIGISDSILNKAGKLTSEEWYQMKKHPEIGYRIAQSTTELCHIADLILTHHERWDGTGYPQGLDGEKIPKLSRILAIIDAFDVMTNIRPYKSPISKEDAIAEIIQCSGTQFDPELVDVFVKKIVNV